MNNSLRLLKELTECLPELPRSPMPAIVEYTIENGLAFGIDLLNRPEVAVQSIAMSAGSVFSEHYHDVDEWVLTYEGAYILHRPGMEDVRMGTGQMVHFPPGQPHSGTILENTRVISISIPADEGYPDARTG